MGSGRELRRLSMKQVKSKARLRKKMRLKKISRMTAAYREDTVLAVALEEQRAIRAAKKRKEKQVSSDDVLAGIANGELFGGKRKYWPGVQNIIEESTGPGTSKKNKRSNRQKWDDTAKKLFDSDCSPASAKRASCKKMARKKTVVSGERLEEETLVAAEDFKKRFHPTLRDDDQADWAIGDEQRCARVTPYKKNVDRFAKVVVKPQDCFYRSNLQTTVREVVKLRLTEVHLAAIKCTPFWFFVNSLRTEDYDTLLVITKKYEDDIRAIMRRFDHVDQVFRFGSTKIKLRKRDAVLLFGIVDGTLQILPQGNEYLVTPWMRRCFPNARFEGRNGRALCQLKKCHIYRNLERLCSLEGPEHAEDVARTMHIYLMAAFFMPNLNTTIAWAVCAYLEEFEDICRFDWGTLIVEHLEDQLTKTTTMKVSGCAMLLPYFLCERTCLIERGPGGSFPRYLSWNLQALHVKLMCGDMTAEWEKLVAVEPLLPNLDEKVRFRRLRDETQYNPSQELGETQPIGTAGGDDVSASILEEIEEYDDGADVDSAISSPMEDAESIDMEIGCGTMRRKKLLSDCEDGDALELGEKTPDGKGGMEPDLLDTPTKTCGSLPEVCEEDTTDVVFDTPLCAQGASASGRRNSMTPPSCSLKFCSTLMNENCEGRMAIPVLLDADKTTLLEEVARLKTSLEESWLIGARLTEERDGLKTRLSSRSAAITLLETQSGELQVALEKLRRCMQDITVDYIRRVSDINVEIMTLKEEWDEMTVERENNLKVLNDRLTEAEKERDAKVEELVEMKECIQTVRQGWKDKEASLDNQLKVLRSRVTDGQAVVENLQANLNAVVSERDSIAGQLEAFLNPSDTQILADPENQIKMDLASANGVLQRKCDENDREIIALKQSIIGKDEIIRVLRAKGGNGSAVPAVAWVGAERSPSVEDLPQQVTKIYGKDQPAANVTEGSGTPMKVASNVAVPGEIEKRPHEVSACLMIVPVNEQASVGNIEEVTDRTPDRQECEDQKLMLPNPGTAARAVKRRTVEDTRKPKPKSPLCGPSYRPLAGPHRSIVIQGQFLWDRSCPTICRAIGPVMQRIHVAFEQPNDTVIWRGKGRYAQVTAEDALRVLHNEDVPGEIIDSWGEILLNMLGTKEPVRSSYVMTSKLWDLMETTCLPETRKVIYEQIREAMKEEIIVMPVTTPGLATDLRRDGNHWIMMKYNVKTATWVYHNSKIPPNGAIDPHYKRCLLLRPKVEAIMKAALVANGRNTPLTNPVRGVKPMQQADIVMCPQQRPNSRDSGVIVCHEIEKILKRSGVGSIGKVDGGMYADSTSSYYRCRMIEAFCMPHTLD